MVIIMTIKMVLVKYEYAGASALTPERLTFGRAEPLQFRYISLGISTVRRNRRSAGALAAAAGAEVPGDEHPPGRLEVGTWSSVRS
jgi:hypothetical protein